MSFGFSLVVKARVFAGVVAVTYVAVVTLADELFWVVVVLCNWQFAVGAYGHRGFEVVHGLSPLVSDEKAARVDGYSYEFSGFCIGGSDTGGGG
jgi:hypothetical protein